MKRFSTLIATVILIASIFLLFDKLFSPQPIQIILETGQEVNTQTSDYFTLNEVLLMLVCSFLIGTAAIYLFYNSDKEKIVRMFEPKKEEKYEVIIPLLKDDEKKVVLELRKNNGEIMQNSLVLSLGFSKVKITRILAGLERKNLIVKERYGFTNKIRMK